MPLVRAITTFHAPGNILIPEGGLYDSSDPVVKGRERLFEAVEGATSGATTQTATARPGARSNARRVTKKKAPAKKAPAKKAPAPTPEALAATEPKSDPETPETD